MKVPVVVFEVAPEVEVEELHGLADGEVKKFSSYMETVAEPAGGPLVNSERVLLRSYLMWKARESIRTPGSLPGSP